MTLPIPVTVLTGFLGSGKTTVLKHLMRDPSMRGTAVIVNEFGEVGLDDALIEATEEETVLLPSGCVCCAVRGDLVKALISLADRAKLGDIPALDRVVIETTGLADPAPIAQTLMSEEELFRTYTLDGIVTTVDAELGRRQLDAHYEPAKQVAIADRLLLTKTDRADGRDIKALSTRLRDINPSAQMMTIAHGVVAAEDLFDVGAHEPIAIRADAEGWLNPSAYAHDPSCDDPHCDHPDHKHDHQDHNGHHHHDHAHVHHDHHEHSFGHLHGILSFCLTFETPLDARKLSMGLEMLRSVHGEKLLRMKGIVNVVGEPNPFVVHGVQHVFYPPTTLEEWPSEDRQSRIVFITRGLTEDVVRTVLEPLLTPEPARTEPRFAE